MTLQEAKEQIAKNHLLETWTFLCNVKDKHYIIEAYEEAVDLVLSSKDKEIESLKSDSKDWHDSYQASLKEIAELKDKIQSWKNQFDTLKESSQSELSKLKEENKQLFPDDNQFEKEYNRRSESTLPDGYDKKIYLAGFNQCYQWLKRSKHQQIQSLQEEIQGWREELRCQGIAKDQEIEQLREEMKKKEEEISAKNVQIETLLKKIGYSPVK